MSKIKSEEAKLVENFGALGRAIRVGANSYVSLNKPGFGIKFHVPTVDLVIGIGKDHVAYLVMDAYEPLAFLVTFLICGWGFVLIWKSDNDLRFKMAQMKIEELEGKLEQSRMFVIPAHLLKRKRVNH